MGASTSTAVMPETSPAYMGFDLMLTNGRGDRWLYCYIDEVFAEY
jgi:hypothetical protein